MARWFRVFAAKENMPGPEEVLEHFRSQGVEASGEFDRGESGWYVAVIDIEQVGQLRLERFLADEEGVRAELNSWAAWVEPHVTAPLQVLLMERIIQARQVVTVSVTAADDDPELVAPYCTGLCRFLAHSTGGIWQADDAGLFAADGTLLVEEC
jgi:hypothetical protein